MPDLDPFIFLYNVLAILHIAGSTDVSMRGIVKAVAENIGRVEINLKPIYCKYLKILQFQFCSDKLKTQN